MEPAPADRDVRRAARLLAGQLADRLRELHAQRRLRAVRRPCGRIRPHAPDHQRRNRAAPAWSPDGTRIAYARMSQSDLEGQVATVSPLGGPEQAALREPAQTAIDAGPWWSPDGSRLLVADHLASNDRELYLTFGSRSRVRQLTSNGVDDSDPAVSPDGRFLAFDRGNVGDEEVYVRRLAAGAPASDDEPVHLRRRAGVVARRDEDRLREQPHRRPPPHLRSRRERRPRPPGHGRWRDRRRARVVARRRLDRVHVVVCGRAHERALGGAAGRSRRPGPAPRLPARGLWRGRRTVARTPISRPSRGRCRRRS